MRSGEGVKSVLLRGEAGLTFGLAAFGLLLMILSYRLGLGSMKEPGPGFLPFFIGFLMMIFGSLLLGRLVTAKTKKEAGGLAFDGRSGIKRFTGMIVFFCLWLILMPWLGFIIVTFLVSLGFAKMMGLENWLKPLLISCGTTLFIYLIFDVWFYIDLPRGILG